MGGKGSGRPTRYEQIKNDQLQKISVDYLVDNFETFDEPIKLKIALNIASKITPQTTNINQTIEEQKKEQMDVAYDAIRKFGLMDKN